MTRFGPLAAAMTLTLLVLSARADDVTDQLDAARKAYDTGELRGAIQALSFATARIQEKINDQLLKLLPEPLPGWQADAAQSEAGALRRWWPGPSSAEPTDARTAPRWSCASWPTRP